MYDLNLNLAKNLAKSIGFVKADIATMGNQVHPEAMVEGSITCMQGVQVHLDLIKMVLVNGDGFDGLFLSWENVNHLWESIVSNTVAEVHGVFFDWLDGLTDEYIDQENKYKVVAKLDLYLGPRSASYHRLYTANREVIHAV